MMIQELGEKNSQTTTIYKEISKILKEKITNSSTQETKETSNHMEVSKTKQFVGYRKEIMDRLYSAQITYKEPYVQMAMDIKSKIQRIVDQITSEDLEAIFQQNLNPEKISLDLFEDIIEENKKTIQQGNYEEIEKEVESKLKEYESTFSNVKTLQTVITELLKNNLPVTQKMISKVFATLGQLENVKKLSNQDIINVIKQNKELTLENVYQGKFMGNSTSSEVSQDIHALEKQIEALLKEHQLDISKENVDLAKQMINQDISLDKTNLLSVHILKIDVQELDQEHVIQKAVWNAAHGKPIGDISLFNDQPISDHADSNLSLKKDLEKIDLVHIKRLVQNNQQITISNLKNAVEEESLIEGSKEFTSEQTITTIKAKLNLEEIRLRMTSKAMNTLNVKGYSIETESLENVVKKLREIEQELYKSQLERQDIPVNEKNINQVEEVFTRLQWLKQTSSNAIAKVVAKEIDFTLESMSNEARMERIQKEALENYEVLGTKPRKDLGDRLEKTFQQIDGLLEEIGLEKSEKNLRAAKILASNGMELSPENIHAIRLVDAKVVALTEQLHPSAVVNMIKQNYMPVKMHIDELLAFVQQFKEYNGITSKENIHENILQIQNDSNLSKEEKESLIGIYRMFSTIAKSKGTATGFLVKNGMNLTLDNLFEAAKFIKKTNDNQSSIHANIGDDFGFVEKVVGQDKLIKQQIQKAFQVQADSKEVNYSSDEQTLIELMDIELEELFGRDWISVKEILDGKLSVEQLLEEATEKQSTFESQKMLEKIHKLVDMDLELLKNFSKYELKPTVRNLLLANDLNNEPFGFAKSLQKSIEYMDIQHKQVFNNLLAQLEKSHSVSEYKETLERVRSYLEDVQEELINPSISNNEGALENIKTTTNILEYQQAMLSEDEYYQVPMMINGKLTQLNLYFVNNDPEAAIHSSEGMKVYLYFQTNNLDKVQAMLHIREQAINFSVYAKDRQDLEYIKGFENELKTLLKFLPYPTGEIQYDYFEGVSPLAEQIKEPTAIKKEVHESTQFEITI